MWYPQLSVINVGQASPRVYAGRHFVFSYVTTAVAKVFWSIHQIIPATVKAECMIQKVLLLKLGVVSQLQFWCTESC